MLSKADKGFPGPSFNEVLQEERQEGNEENQEDRDDAPLHPIKDWDQIIASRLTRNHIALRIDLTDR